MTSVGYLGRLGTREMSLESDVAWESKQDSVSRKSMVPIYRWVLVVPEGFAK